MIRKPTPREAGKPTSGAGWKAAPPSTPPRRRSRASGVAVAVAIILTVLKLITGWATGSLAMVASGIDSLMDSLGSFINLLALRQAERPADREHRYGHGKAEALAALFQALVIGVSAVGLVAASVGKLLHPQPLSHQRWGIAVMLVALGATFCLIRYLRHAAARTNSLALRADAVHYETDLYTGFGVLAAFVINAWTGIMVFDPLFSLALAGLVFVLALRVGRQAVQQLMDRELPSGARRAIIALIECHYPSIRGFHELRTRTSGPSVFIDVHIEVDLHASFEEAHAITEHLVADIERLMTNAQVTIHTDPVRKQPLAVRPRSGGQVS